MTSVLSGFRPTGALHLGNYAGAIKPLKEYLGSLPPDNMPEVTLLIADLHALNNYSQRDVSEFSWLIREDLNRLFKGSKRTSVILQSDDNAFLGSLVLRLLNHVTLGELLRNHATKMVGDKGSVNMGLLLYPVLMAADCAGFDKVVVGKDQKQHMELVRDFLGRIGEPLPDTLILEANVLPGLDGNKMSKSRGNTIPLYHYETEEDLRKLYLSIKTDSASVSEPKPADCLLAKYAGVLDLPPAELQVFLTGGVSYLDFKQRLYKRHLEVFT